MRLSDLLPLRFRRLVEDLVAVRSNCAELQRAVEGAGFFTSFQPIERPGNRMVCGSRRYPEGHERAGLYGNSFSVAKRGANWYVLGWGPAIYDVPDGRRVLELCLRPLRREAGGPYGDFDEQVRREFALTRVTDDEFGRAGSA